MEEIHDIENQTADYSYCNDCGTELKDIKEEHNGIIEYIQECTKCGNTYT